MKALEVLQLRSFALAFALTLGCAACGGSSSGGPPISPEATFKPGPCPAAQAEQLAQLNASCGTLTAPENRSKRSEGNVQLPVAIIPSQKQPPAPDPIVYMAGGPGANAIEQAPILASVGLNQNRDLIIMNQRGVAYTLPELTCPEIDEFYAEAVGLRYDDPATGVLHVAATNACHDRLVGEGIDLSAFNTSENSADFADLRKALKIKQWNIYGLSYGTDLALSIMRDYPEGIRSVIIDSVVPPSAATLGWTWTNANEAINDIFRACNDQADCLSTYGDLSATFAAQVQKLEANPLTITVPAPFPGGGNITVVLDGGALVNWLGSVPVPTMAIPSIPSAIEELVQGQPTQIATSRAAQADPAAIGAVGYGLMLGVICSEWVPFEPQSQILVQGLLAFPTYPQSVLSLAPGLPFMTEDCGVWNVPPADASVRQVTISSIPTLVMAGDFDGKTSPQWAIYAAGTLKNSTTVVIPGGGHGALFLFGLPDDSPAKPCAQSVVESFLSNPITPDTSCVASLTPYPFGTSASMLSPDQLNEELDNLDLFETHLF
jgi:pimeloyl-ACP methyl ester carboxylesterase